MVSVLWGADRPAPPTNTVRTGLTDVTAGACGLTPRHDFAPLSSESGAFFFAESMMFLCLVVRRDEAMTVHSAASKRAKMTPELNKQVSGFPIVASDCSPTCRWPNP